MTPTLPPPGLREKIRRFGLDEPAAALYPPRRYEALLLRPLLTQDFGQLPLHLFAPLLLLRQHQQARRHR